MKGINIKVLLVFLVLSTGFTLQSGKPVTEWKEISLNEYEKAWNEFNKYYSSKKSYSVDITYTSYKGYDATKEHEQMKGYHKKDGSNFHNYIMGIRTIQNHQVKLTIDSINQSILVSDPDITKPIDGPVLSYEQMKKKVKSYKFHQQADGTLNYRVEYQKGTSFTATEIKASKDYFIKEIILFYSGEYNTDPDDENSKKTNPKLAITYSNFKKDITINKNEFNIKPYVIIDNENKIKLSELYKNYELLDLRVSIYKSAKNAK